MSGIGDKIKKPSDRLRHGLSSRTRRENLRDEATELAKELIWHGNTTVTHEIRDVAADLADTIFLLQAIKSERRKILSTPAPPSNYDQFITDEGFENFRQEVLHSGFLENLPPEDWAQNLMLVIKYPDVVATHRPSLNDIPRLLRSRKSELRRLDEYERRARSRHSKLIYRLDYLIIEAARDGHEEDGKISI